jgi:hypothetical protein
MNIEGLIPLWLRYRIMEVRGRGIYSVFADEHKCIFIHIPKAAGTSVARTLFRQPSRHVAWFEYFKANPRKFKKYFKFAFVRNPWDRLVSSYFFLRKGGMNAADASWAESNLQAYPDFGSFVRGWVNEANVHSWVHFKPQHYFICREDDKIMMDFLGRMETIDSDFAFLAKKLGCSYPLEKVNVGSREHYSRYYDDETQEIVRRVYAKDIELFGYSFENKVGA